MHWCCNEGVYFISLLLYNRNWREKLDLHNQYTNMARRQLLHARWRWYESTEHKRIWCNHYSLKAKDKPSTRNISASLPEDLDGLHPSPVRRMLEYYWRQGITNGNCTWWEIYMAAFTVVSSETGLRLVGVHLQAAMGAVSGMNIRWLTWGEDFLRTSIRWLGLS